jgi:hypothetical protein
MTFVWDDTVKQPEKTEEEMMDEFDRSFDAWGRVKRNG